MNLSGSVHILSRHVRKSHLGLLTSPPSWIFLYIYIYILSQQMSRVGAMPQDSRGFGAVEAVQSIPDEWRFS